jgi:hypothetical protein
VNDLERALRELPVEWPETPDLASRLVLEPRGKIKVPGTFRLRIAALIVALLVGGTLAVPEARSTVLRWLGIESVEIRRGEPSATPGASLHLGTPTTLADLRAPVLTAPGLGTPGVYATRLPDGSTAASLVYPGPVLVQTFKAQASPFIGKTVGSGATVERLTVDGATAFWIEGGHGFAYESPAGFGFEDQRIAGSTLLVERADGLLLRIEGVPSRDRAVAIARSVQ